MRHDQCRSFELEANAYNGSLEKNMGEIPFPKGYFACCDQEAARFTLLLEDLSSRGGNFAPGDQIAGTRMPHCLGVAPALVLEAILSNQHDQCAI